MLPALPVDKISTRGPAMAGAARDKSQPAGETTRPGRGGAKKPAGGRRPGKGKERPQPAVLPPVREGEDAWTVEELEAVRSQLEHEVGELGRDIEASELQIAESDSSDGAGDDQADLGTKTYAREHEMSLALNARDLLAQNERAIHRIDAGTYGVCESCGSPIGKARLQAFPRATLCVTCKQREERR